LQAMDQPSIDGINTWYASKAVAELGLKVVVSGVGGDELFQGYSSFAQLPRLVSNWSVASRIPGSMSLAKLLCRVQAKRSGNQRWNHFPEWSRTMSGAWWLRRGLFSPDELPLLMGRELAAEGLRSFSPDARINEMSGTLAIDLRSALSQIESTTYLRNQLLRDSDWASMDHSVELRTPLVDAALLAELAPLLNRFSAYPNKSLLSQAPRKALPQSVIQRRKTGFGIPVAAWLRSTLHASSGGNKSLGSSQQWARYVAEAFDK
jgi:asparagine synthase (glutamine-hydrolysing)